MFADPDDFETQINPGESVRPVSFFPKPHAGFPPSTELKVGDLALSDGPAVQRCGVVFFLSVSSLLTRAAVRQNALPLSNSEALQIMERSKLDFQTEKRVPSDAFARMFEHASHFAHCQTEASARESRNVVKHLDISEVHQVALCDLMPTTAEEAKSLIRALDKIPDDELQRVLDDLASCSTKMAI